MKWQVFYTNATENIKKAFTVKASNKQQATNKAIEKVKTLYGFDDRLLNNYSISLAIN